MAAMPHLLIVDDDDDILSLLTNFFRKHSHVVTVAADGAAMFAALERHPIDLVMLDVMLPREDGFSLCKKLRAVSRVPVIMLTAVSDHTDRTVGLELGPHDYVTKPFDQRELLARVKAVLRRTAETLAAPAPSDIRPIMCFGDWRLDVARRELRSADDTLVLLSGGEFDLLLAFVERPQRVLTRDQLLDMARGPAHAAYDRSIDTLVSRLRHKLAAGSKAPSVIRTVRNGGYVFEAKVTRA
jgi:two-component system OmpR family response regulator